MKLRAHVLLIFPYTVYGYFDFLRTKHKEEGESRRPAQTAGHMKRWCSLAMTMREMTTVRNRECMMVASCMMVAPCIRYACKEHAYRISSGRHASQWRNDSQVPACNHAVVGALQGLMHAWLPIWHCFHNVASAARFCIDICTLVRKNKVLGPQLRPHATGE